MVFVSRRGAESAGMDAFNKDNLCLFVFLCVLCAFARDNICSFFDIANPGCKFKIKGRRPA